MSEPPNPNFVKFMTFGFLSAGVALLAFGFWFVNTAKVSQSWPTVTGKVASSRVRSSHSKNSHRSYFVEVKYRYTVDGKEYSSKRYQLGSGSNHGNHGEAEAAEEELKKFPVGSDIVVHYDPLAPDSAVLNTEVDWGVYVPGILGFLSLALGLVLVKGLGTSG